MEEMIKYLKALVLLQVQGLSEEAASLKPEVILSRAGFTAREIAQMVSKNEGAVAKALHRAKTSRREAY